MISWDEQPDRYVLRVNRWESVFAWSLFTLATAAPMVAFELQSSSPEAEGRVCCYGIFLPLVAIGLMRVVACARQRGWIEVSLRGGLARWWSPGRQPMSEGEPVKMFAVDGLSAREATVDVVLPDGAQVRALGSWRTTATPRVCAAVRQLNELLTPTAPGDMGTAPPASDPPPPPKT